MKVHHITQTSTDPAVLLGEVNLVLNKHDIGNGPDDPPISVLITPTGKFEENEAILTAFVFEGHKVTDIATELMS